MSLGKHAVVLLASSNHALKAEKLLIEAGFACKLIPVPRKISAECGVCVRIEIQDRPAVLALLSDLGFQNDGIIDI